ncbi:CGNR zinc finger domain-containing protein [Dactylosporangium sp. NPDC051541]|uniref:CGNR zinc finger domain-containing protein n=1 Tax=Dactylosporangium sp. NPDC051541 TaxID=3363977 RepID=UPI00379E6C4D
MTRRFGADPAPGGLCLVQDLANSAHNRAAGLGDGLADRRAARGWLADALVTWAAQTGQAAPRLTLVEPDLAPLRQFRDRLRAWLGRRTDDFTVPARAVRVALRAGRPTYAPQGDGADGVVALVQAELLLAVHTGKFSRLKTCANADCAAVFYDTSADAGRVWHDDTSCGPQ